LDFERAKGSKITIITADRREVISSPIDYKGVSIAEDFKTAPVDTYTFEMVPAPALIKLTEGEPVHGSLVIDMGNEEWLYTLHETPVQILHWEVTY
jgi:hypothetical protein